MTLLVGIPLGKVSKDGKSESPESLTTNEPVNQ